MKQDSPSAVDPAAPPDTLTKPAPYQAPKQAHGAPRRSRRVWVWLAVLVLAAAIAYYFWSKNNPAGGASGAAAQAQKKGPAAIPVVAAKARKGNIPVYFTGLGAVTPIYTVEVRSRVDGELMQINFKEGELVHKGDALVEIDPRPYQVQLTQAEGQLIPDQGAIDSPKLNITYSHILAPITGRLGLRLVDPGNIVHASDTNALLVITQIDPISVIFTIPEDQLPVVVQRFSAGQHLNVEAWDRTSNTKLATGVLATLDNQIDPTTGSLRLRANFDNKNNKLFPNQFVNVKLLVQLKQNVTLIPTATVQRNSQTTYVFLVQPNNKATVRPITLGTTEGDDSEVTAGLVPGDVIVMTGVDKLQEGTLVTAHLTGDTGHTPGRPVSGPLPAGAPAPAALRQATTPAHKGR